MSRLMHQPSPGIPRSLRPPRSRSRTGRIRSRCGSTTSRPKHAIGSCRSASPSPSHRPIDLRHGQRLPSADRDPRAYRSNQRQIHNLVGNWRPDAIHPPEESDDRDRSVLSLTVRREVTGPALAPAQRLVAIRAGDVAAQVGRAHRGRPSLLESRQAVGAVTSLPRPGPEA
jgi:hypothetical protein